MQAFNNDETQKLDYDDYIVLSKDSDALPIGVSPRQNILGGEGRPTIRHDVPEELLMRTPSPTKHRGDEVHPPHAAAHPSAVNLFPSNTDNQRSADDHQPMSAEAALHERSEELPPLLGEDPFSSAHTRPDSQPACTPNLITPQRPHTATVASVRNTVSHGSTAAALFPQTLAVADLSLCGETLHSSVLPPTTHRPPSPCNELLGNLPETLDDGCPKPEESILEQNCSEPTGAATVEDPPEQHKDTSSSAEDDAPLLEPQPSPRAARGEQAAQREPTPVPRAAFTAGMEVEAKWGGLWYAATVKEDENHGFVQIGWKDGSLMHLHVREVRLPKPSKARQGRKQSQQQSGAAFMDRADKAVAPITGTQLMFLMDEEDAKEEKSARVSSRGSSKKRPRDVPDESIVDVCGTGVPCASLVVYVSSACSASHAQAIHHLAARGAYITSSLSSWIQRSCESASSLSFFILVAQASEVFSPDKCGISDSIPTPPIHLSVFAHAVGVPAVLPAWLLSLRFNGSCVALPARQDLHAMTAPLPHSSHHLGDDAFHVLPMKKRSLTGRTVYCAERDPLLELILAAAGGRFIAETGSLPPPSEKVDYIYTTPLRHARATPLLPLLELPWLCTEIRTHFLRERASAPEAATHAVQSPLAGEEPGELFPSPASAGAVVKSARPPPALTELSSQSQLRLVPTQLVGAAAPNGKTEEAAPRPTPSSNEPEIRLGHALPSTPRRGRRRSPILARNADVACEMVRTAKGEEVMVGLGEDYYFQVSVQPVRGMETSAIAPSVSLGRVVHLSRKDGDVLVTLQLYDIKYRTMHQNPRTHELEQQTTICLSPRSITVPAASLLFDIAVFIVPPSSLRHVYVLEDGEPTAHESALVPGYQTVAQMDVDEESMQHP